MNRLGKVFAASMFLLLVFSAFALAQNAQSIAVVISVTGPAEIQPSGGQWGPISFGAVLNSGDKIRTANEGYVALVFTDDRSQIRIRPNSEVTVSADREEDNSLSKRLSVEVGELFADVQEQKGRLQVATPTTVASVKGTQFWVVVEINGETTVIALEGLLELINQISGQTINLEAGNFAISDELGELIQQVLGDDYTLPDWTGDGGGTNQIEIQFQDANGETRTLIINYNMQE